MKINDQPTLIKLLQKTGVDLGKNWANEIYKNERTHQRRQNLVYDQLKTDDTKKTKEEVN